MKGDRQSAGAPADGGDWDARYAVCPQVWSGNPNMSVLAMMMDVTPGTAVDVGRGEGADAIWLAQRGRHVTAFDVSSTALARAAARRARRGLGDPAPGWPGRRAPG